ncbi:MAG: putative Ig domain-containing protein, partial [Chloroflexota bacterium]
DSFTWTVTNANQAPVFSTEFGDRTDAEGALISFDADASDPDGTTLTYSATNLPNGITINSTTGIVSGTLSTISSGTYNTVITVSDGSLTDTDSFTWTVTEALVIYVDDTFTRTSANSWGSATPTGGTYTLTGTAANFAVSGGVGSITSPSAGVLRSALLNTPSATDVDVSFRVRADKVAAGGAQFIYGVVRRNGNNEYRVKLRLAVNGNVYVQASTVVNNVETSIGAEVQVPGLTHTANAFLRFRAQVSGSNPTTIRIRAWADAAVEPSTWNYVQTNSNASLQGAGALGLRTYIASATTNAPVVFGFDDYRVTSLGPPNQAPVFSTEFGDRTDAEGDAVSLDANASDPDAGTTLVYSATGLPDGITINSSTGVFGGTLSTLSSGIHNVVLTVSDGALADTDSFTWTVTDNNQAPVFSTNFGNRTDAEGAVISLDANATDPDLDALTYSATGLPNGITINSTTGVFGGTLSFASAGTYNTVITVSDGSLTDTDSFTWTVTNTNQAPVFSTEFGDRTDAEGALISFDADASDPDGTTLTYSATNLPNGITINSTTGIVSGTLSTISSGTYNTVITVSDGSLTDTDSFTWTVTEPSAVTVYASDLFGRTVVNSWSSASTGGAYTLQGTAADYDVTGSAGTITFGAGINRSAVLSSVSALDVDLSFRVATNRMAAGGAQFIYGIVRRVSSTAEYRAKLRLAVNGNVYIQASSVVNNTETPIGSEVQVPGLTYTPGNFIWLRAQFSGTSPTTIRVRAWADGSAEPVTWQYNATNSVASLQAAGAVGVRGYMSGATTNAPILLTFDDFRATSLGGP